MANSTTILLFFALSLFISSVLSRTYSESHTTQFFDVSASIQKTLWVFSMNRTVPKFEQEQLKIPVSGLSSDFLSLTLHPRSALLKPRHKNYESLTLSRFARDSARVHSLTARLRFAVNNFSQSVQTAVEAVALQAPITSGASQGSGEYFARVGVGRPAKQFYMVVDTGSDVSWLQCQPCSDCYQQSDSIFDPNASSTYNPLTCDSPRCSSLDISACRAGRCVYQVSYGDGSYTVGDFVSETMSFGSSGSVSSVAIGCGHDNEGLFIGAAGLIGLGGGSLSLPSQIAASSFSYCLVDRDSDSSSSLDFNSAQPGDSVVAPMLRNSRVDTFFYVGVTGISVGGQLVSIPSSIFEVDQSGNGGIIVDSGTAVTRLQTDAYNSLRDAFVRLTRHLPSSSAFALFDTCYDLSSMSRISVPTVSFEFSGGRTLPLHPTNYLIPVDSAGKFCFAFAPTDGSLSIIGNVQQQGTRVSYDIANKRIGFTPNNC